MIPLLQRKGRYIMDHHESRNLVIMIAVSFLILLGWQYFYEMPRQKVLQEQLEIAKEAEEAKAKQIEFAPSTAAPEKAATNLSREETLGLSKRIAIVSRKLHGSIALKGARLDDLTFVQYRQAVEPTSPPVVLFSPSGTEAAYFAEFGWAGAAGGSIAVPNAETMWQSNRKTLTPEMPVQLKWDSPQGVRFTITIALDENYMFTVTQAVENKTLSPIQVAPYALLSRTIHQLHREFLISHEGALGVLNGILYEETYHDLTEDAPRYEQVKGWLGIADKYWLSALVPAQDTPFNVRFNYQPKGDLHRYQVDAIKEAVTVEPATRMEIMQRLFAGPKELELLENYETSLAIPMFDHAVDFGWLYFLTKPIFITLKYFHQFLGNFGLAILALTIIIKLLLFPLANKSFRSMGEMKRLHPKMMELRERYKNDKLLLNQEMMALYKREKVNPMAGCLPILVQIPIFFALYKVLFITIEMRHAPFYGWINDLSAPDPTTVFNLFGLLPFSLPVWLPVIGVWPLLMGVTMYVQQLLNPTPPDPVQAKVMKALPFVFVFILAPFPAGLVIYWTWSNLLSILQQYVITRGIMGKKKVESRT